MTIERNIFKYIWKNQPVAPLHIKQDVDLNGHKWSYYRDKLRGWGLTKSVKINNLNSYAYYISGTEPDTVAWDEVFAPKEFLTVTFQDDYLDIYEFLKDRPAMTGYIADEFGLTIHRARHIMQNMRKHGLIESTDETRTDGKTHHMPGVDPVEFEYEKRGYESQFYPTHRIDTAVIDLFKTIKNEDRYYWKTHHLKDYGFKPNRDGDKLGTLSNLNLIQKWASENSPWILTDKGENMTVKRLKELSPKF